MIKVSIIVPIYNVEKYLDRCLERLTNQTLKEIEIILVNDKSPDNSHIICQKYAQNDSRIKIINKEKNEGLGFARNSGLKLATGEFVAFVDSDDYIDYDFYERLYKNSKGADIIMGAIKDVDNEGKIINIYNNPLAKNCFSNEEVNEILYNMLGMYDKNIYFSAAVWRALYKRELLLNYNIRFCSEREFISEDYIFHLDVIPKCRKIQIVDGTYYYYCINDSSLTRKYNPTRFEKIKILYNEILRKLENESLLTEESEIRCKYTFIGNVRACIKQEGYNENNVAEKNILNICSDQLVQKYINSGYKQNLKQKIFDYLIQRKKYKLLKIIIKGI